MKGNKMFKYIKIFMILTSLALIMVSCNEPDMLEDFTVKNLKIIINQDDDKTIGYDGSLSDGIKDISHINIMISDETGNVIMDSKWLEKKGDTMSWVINSITTGKYEFTVSGAIKMTDGQMHVIAKNTSVVSITRSTTQITLSLNTLICEKGTGMNITLELPADMTYSEGLYKGRFKYQVYESDLTTSINDAGYSGDIQFTSENTSPTLELKEAVLDPGTYGLKITLIDENNPGKEWQTVDALRILPGLNATGTVTFNRPEETDFVITIKEGVGGEINVTTGDYKAAVTSKTLTVSLPGIENKADVLWFVNGAKNNSVMNDDGTWNISGLEFGLNIISCLVFDDTALGTGSLSFVAYLDKKNLVELPVSELFYINIDNKVGSYEALSQFIPSGEKLYILIGEQFSSNVDVWQTTDGTNWENAEVKFPSGFRISSRNLIKLVYNPLDKFIYFYTLNAETNKDIYLRSKDCINWEEFTPTGLPENLTSNGLSIVNIGTEESPIFVLNSAITESSTGTANSVSYYSYDCINWTKMNSGAYDFLFAPYFTAFSSNYAICFNYLTGQVRYLDKSNLSSGWMNSSLSIILDSTLSRMLTFAVAIEEKFYVGINDGKIYESDDGGKTFYQISEQTDFSNYTSGSLPGLASAKQMVIFAPDASGLYVTSDFKSFSKIESSKNDDWSNGFSSNVDRGVFWNGRFTYVADLEDGWNIVYTNNVNGD